ncbi:MAG: hypothetical protein HOP34_09265 [Methylococcaceae bacterium]|nr:hypothetical protein [Methylococcaceae bacterium]
MISQSVDFQPTPYIPACYSQTVEGKPSDYFINNSKSVSCAELSFSNHIGANSTKVREPSKGFNELIGKAPWVVEFLQSASKLNDVKSLLPFYMEINKLISHGELNLCNEFLKQVRVNDLSDVLLVGLLRLTSSHKNELPYWTRLLASAKTELSNRKHDSNAILKGLL